MAIYGTNDFIWTGMDTLQGFFRMVSPRATAAMGDGILAVLDEVFAQSQQQVPVDTGALRSSGHINDLETGSGLIQGSIGYGAPYAFYVHEDLHMHHPRGGKAKYLSDPMQSALSSLARWMEGRLEAALVGQGAGAGSKNQAAESASLAKSVNKRSLAQRRGMSEGQVEEALRRMREYGGTNTQFRSRRGRLSVSHVRAPKERFDYEPTRHGFRFVNLRTHQRHYGTSAGFRMENPYADENFRKHRRHD